MRWFRKALVFSLLTPKHTLSNSWVSIYQIAHSPPGSPYDAKISLTPISAIRAGGLFAPSERVPGLSESSFWPALSLRFYLWPGYSSFSKNPAEAV